MIIYFTLCCNILTWTVTIQLFDACVGLYTLYINKVEINDFVGGIVCWGMPDDIFQQAIMLLCSGRSKTQINIVDQ